MDGCLEAKAFQTVRVAPWVWPLLVVGLWLAIWGASGIPSETQRVALDRQISTVTTAMRAARTKQEFEDWFERAYPGIEAQLPLVIDIGRD